MLNEQSLEKLYAMKLTGMADAFAEQLQQPDLNELSFEEELAQDVLEIITVFSARLYGRRSHKNRQLIERLQDVAEEL